MEIDSLKYYTKSCRDLTDFEIEKSSNLFSEHYGFYGDSAPKEKKGSRIKLGRKYYKNLRSKPNYFVSFAFDKDLLVGHAYFLRKETSGGMASWVIQLVVRKEYRNNSIGSKLLHSVWGFSNDYAWGLATSNPLTVKTLESATVRKVIPAEIDLRKEIIFELAQDVTFVEARNMNIETSQSNVFNGFYVDQRDINHLLKAYEDEWLLGQLDEGYEWIAFTFRDQKMKDLTKSQLDIKLKYSDDIVKDAYSRMEMKSHTWTKYSKQEIDFILSQIDLRKEAEIADFGCGYGRHLLELRNKGFLNLNGVDFSKSNIENAEKLLDGDGTTLVCGDCRDVKFSQKFDLVLCLYDVIGSFPNEIDNDKIIDNIAFHTMVNGFIVISVMNFELTESLVKEKIDIYENPKPLFHLKASNTMQTSGDIFDPEFILIDKNTNLVFRKEIFENENHLSAEYIIRDKRYTMNEIEKKLIDRGFTILVSRFVQAGKWNTKLISTDRKAKEILVIARKK